MKEFEKAYDLLYHELERLNNKQIQTLYTADPHTGEMVPVVEEVSTELLKMIHSGRSRTKDLQFIMLYQEPEKTIAREVSGTSLKILCYLRACMKYENTLFGVTYRNISDAINVSVRSVVRAIEELVSLNIIKASGGKKRTYHLNPATAWKGALSQQKAKLEMFSENGNFMADSPELPDAEEDDIFPEPDKKELG